MRARGRMPRAGRAPRRPYRAGPATAVQCTKKGRGPPKRTAARRFWPPSAVRVVLVHVFDVEALGLDRRFATLALARRLLGAARLGAAAIQPALLAVLLRGAALPRVV